MRGDEQRESQMSAKDPIYQRGTGAEKAEEEVRAILDHLAAQDEALSQMHQLLMALRVQSSEWPEDEVKP